MDVYEILLCLGYFLAAICIFLQIYSLWRYEHLKRKMTEEKIKKFCEDLEDMTSTLKDYIALEMSKKKEENKDEQSREE